MAFEAVELAEIKQKSGDLDADGCRLSGRGAGARARTAPPPPRGVPRSPARLPTRTRRTPGPARISRGSKSQMSSPPTSRFSAKNSSRRSAFDAARLRASTNESASRVLPARSSVRSRGSGPTAKRAGAGSFSRVPCTRRKLPHSPSLTPIIVTTIWGRSASSSQERRSAMMPVSMAFRPRLTISNFLPGPASRIDCSCAGHEESNGDAAGRSSIRQDKGLESSRPRRFRTLAIRHAATGRRSLSARVRR